MTDKFLLGIDIGTSSCKIVAFTEKGKPVACTKVDYGLYSSLNGIVEQNANDYWNSTVTALKNLFIRNPWLKGRIQGIGLVGQTPSDIFVDKEGIPLRQVITWQDTRARLEAELINQQYSKDQLFALLGSNESISPSSTASRMLWISHNEPETIKKCYKILQPKDFIGYKLTGNYVSDKWIFKSLVNVITSNINETYLSFLGFNKSHIPEIKPWDSIRGYITKEASTFTGLEEDTPVTNGCSDGTASMLGSGALEKPGIAFNCSGTSEIIGVSVKKAININELMTMPSSVSGSLSFLYGSTQNGSSTLKWLNNNITSAVNFEQSVDAASTVPAGSEGLLFMPYLLGERAPIWNINAKGSFINVISLHDRRHFTRAVMEGVAFSVRHCLTIAEQAIGCSSAVLRLSGGGSKIPLWCKIKADVCNKTIELLECDNSSALGAAMITAVGIGIYRNLSCASASMVHVSDYIKPDINNISIYNELFKQYLNESARWRMGQ